MRRISLSASVLCTLLGMCAATVTGVASAQQLRPYFLVIVDTSGSMAWCAAGRQDVNPVGSNDCSCHVGNNCNAAYLTNRCGFPSNRIGDAKCSLQRILDGTGGDATFGLLQFEHPCSPTCEASNAGCTNNCGSSPNCDDGQLAVEIQSGNANLMREWVDGQCQGTCGAGSYPRELTTGQWTPIAKSLQRANEYLRGQLGAGFPYITGQSTVSAPLANDPQLACRPVSVILLTDGDDTCAAPTDAPNAAAALLAGQLNASSAGSKSIRTYVIGFGASGGNFNPTVLDNIAMSGGTDSGDTSTGTRRRYFPAMNEEQLSLALNRIIADAQPPQEVCNGMDDDCDGNSDEGVPKFCNKPAGVIGKELCDEPNETLCDGMDDDCDGITDEGLTNACGACGDVPKEICDARDNDCDTRIDEDTNNMETCGKATGECKTGQLVCIAGMDQCRGDVGPTKELCDCLDNDCDGNSDEENPDKLCPSGQRCASCRCVQFCERTTEFDVSCPPGLAADIQPNGECLCIKDDCDPVACPRDTLEMGGEVQCAPNNSRVAPCVCKAGKCVTNCTGVTCKSGEVCDPKKNGRCVEDSCRGLGCANGELCDPGSGRCVRDECANAGCPSDQVCRAGVCEASCANVTCRSGETCKGGSCQAAPCANVTCTSGSVCDPNTGECAADKCATVSCKNGQTCSPSTGQCEAQPCWNVKCPGDQVCDAGECRKRETVAPTPTEPNEVSRLIATGGGGCACSVPGAGGASGHAAGGLSAALGLMLLGVLRLRRRAPQLARLAALCLACVALATLAGCRVSPLCIDCTDAGQATPTEGNSVDPAADGGGTLTDGGGDTQDSGQDAGRDGGNAPVEAGVKCTPTGAETCNDKDDDCDLRVDEDVVPRENSCNQVGVCAGTAPVCLSGAFACRYGAATYEATETLCDGLDNDCNGKVDEPFVMLGASCEAGVGACKAQGKLRCNSAGKGLVCDAVPLNAGEEVCNGKDDDCDGMADEPKNTPGTNPSYVKDDVVKVRSDLWIYQYEASRVDANAQAQGIINTRSCSRRGVLPWTNVTYTEADAACKSVNMTLCTLDNWVHACEGGVDCGWSTAGSCGTYTQGTCNGHDASTQAGQSETDSLKITGGSPNCYSDFMADGRVFDLSGNAKEWTVGSGSPDRNPLRGGSYNNGPEGLRCDFDFTLGAPDLRLPNVGFRCCSNSEP